MNTTMILNSTMLLSNAPNNKPVVGEALYEIIANLLAGIVLTFAVTGVCANAINIRVFIQQGMQDSSIIDLFSLAVADLFGCVFALPMPCCRVGFYISPRTTYLSCSTFVAITCTLTHIVFSRVTCWITVYIAVERCLCILMPFKVKTLLQPRTASTAMTLIYIFVIGSYVPYYAHLRIFWVFHPVLNGTIAL